MITHSFKTQFWLPAETQRVFSFFADAQNLEAITPPWLHFHITTQLPIEMQAGTLIDYRLRLHGWPLRWRTRIAVWEPPFCFVDEQLKGPYKLWVHRHTFVEHDGGTLCCDEVTYAVPGGRFINWLLVRHEVEKIFSHRSRILSSLFAQPAAEEHPIGS